MINREIKAKEVRLIGLGEDGKGTEVVSTAEAIKRAEEQELDLICINQNGEIPVCKIGDYGKYLYEQQRKEREAKKKANQSKQDLKEIQISDGIAENDMKTKAKNVDRILKDGDKVKLSIRYKGRTIKMIGNGASRLEKLMEFITYEFKVDKPIKIEGNTVSTIITPVK